MFNQYFERDKAAALQALAQGQTAKTREEAEQALAVVKQFAEKWYPKPEPPAPTPQDLEAKRDARLYREAWDSLTPEQRKEFEAQHGDVPTMRRLAEQAKAEADSRWMAREQERLNADYEKGMWQGHVGDARKLPATDLDKLFDLSAALEAKRKERMKARAERELLAEAHDDNEEARIIAGFTPDEYSIYLELMESKPTPLQALQQFVKSKQPNPIADVNDPGTLYEIGFRGELPSQPVKPIPTDATKVDDVETLYKMAERDIERGE